MWIALGIFSFNTPHKQKGAKKIVCDSLGVVDFVLKLLDGQVKFFWGIQIAEELKSMLPIKIFLRLAEMTFGLVHASYSWPEWQALTNCLFLHSETRSFSEILIVPDYS